MSEIFPELDPKTFWHRRSSCGTLLAGSVQTPQAVAAPRCYITEQNDSILMYSGLPISPKGAFKAHRADDLLPRWNCLESELEGSYFLAKLSFKQPGLEIKNDCLGMEQVFYYHKGDMWILSNSVLLIEKLVGPQPMDENGASHFLCLGWVGSDSTLRENIYVVPSGQKWTWDQQGFSARKQSVSLSNTLPYLKKNKNPDYQIEQLINHLSEISSVVGDNFRAIECNLTGGKDTRLVLSLLLQSGMNHITYSTSGNPDSKDACIAKYISEIFHLPHQLFQVTTTDVIDNWDDLCVGYIRRNDGMSSLWQIGDTLEFLKYPQTRKVSFWGAGGEVARGYYTKPYQYLKTHSKNGVTRHLIDKKVISSENLIRRNAKACTARYISDFVDEALHNDFSPTDVPDWFFLNQSIGRWSGCNAKRAAPVKDMISLFCTKAFIEASFSIPAIQRLSEPLHFRILKKLQPALHGIPFDRRPWRKQNAWLNIASSYNQKLFKHGRLITKKILETLTPKADNSPSTLLNDNSCKAFYQESWMEKKRTNLLDFCTENLNIWNLIDKTFLEKVLTDRSYFDFRRKHAGLLMRIATLCYYEHDHETGCFQGGTSHPANLKIIKEVANVPQNSLAA